MAFALHVVPSFGTPFAHILTGRELVVGRSSSSDLVIDDEVVSRSHARLFREGQAWFIEDMQSHNGTWLNGKKVERPTAVGIGDVVRLSGNVITVQDAMLSGDSVASEVQRSREVFRNVTELLEREASASLMDERDINLLRLRAKRFKVLNEVQRALAKPLNQKQLLNLVIDRVFDILEPEEVAIFLKDEQGEVKEAASRFRRAGHQSFVLSRNLKNDVMDRGMAALIQDARRDERFSAVDSIMGAGVRSLLAAPLADSEAAFGLIVLHSKTTTRQFSEEDLTLLASLASAAAIRLHNILLMEQAENHLREMNRNLEDMVTERTRELETRNREILRTRDQLIMQEKMASLGTLTAGVAHEMRNPLNFVTNFAELAKDMLGEIQNAFDESEDGLKQEAIEDLKSPLGEAVSNIGYIAEHGARANRIVVSMMEMVREDGIQFHKVDLNVLVKEYVQLAYRGMKAKRGGDPEILIQEQYDEGVGSHEVVGPNVGRVVLNLMNNAMDAVLERQNESPDDFKPKIEIKTVREDDLVSVIIRDNGYGVREQDREDVFTPFFTTKPTGTGNIGLGLSVSYDIIVNQHHGELSLESEEGVFTSVEAKIPTAPHDERDTIPDMNMKE